MLQNNTPKKLKFLVIHCSASRPIMNFTHKNVRQWHEARWGKGAIGYRTVIENDGKPIKMREANVNDIVEENEITWGAAGVNAEAHHICYMGGVDNDTLKAADTRTNAQKKTMENIIRFYIEKMNPDILIAPHYAFANKNCPSFNLPKWLEEIGIPKENIFYRDPLNYGRFYDTGKWS